MNRHEQARIHVREACKRRQMPRKLRPNRPGETHHIFVRGVAKSPLSLDAEDYGRALNLLERTVSRFALICHAWCLMPNHHHFLLTTQEPNVSKSMQWFGSRIAQTFNERHGRSGHLYQGRFGSRLVKDDGYFLQLARYIPLNPVRAGICKAPEEWVWSSYAATAGLLAPPPRYLDARVILGGLGSVSAYVDWVADVKAATAALDEQGRPYPARPPSLARLLRDDTDRSIAIAHLGHGYTHTAIAEYLGVSRSQISRRIAKPR
jgi:REP element-mobilizing transposase RayT